MSRPYGGRVAAARSADRRERLIQAGVELMGSHGVGAMTMRAVCREAALSQKFFYESFTDTDDLLRVVYLHVLDRAEHAIVTATAGHRDRRAVTRCGVDAAAQLVREDPRICRILLIEPIADLSLRKFVRDRLTRMVAASVASRDSIPPRVKMQYATVFGALISLFIEWTEGNLGEDRAAFVEHVTDTVLSSPLSGAGGGQRPGASTFA